MYRNCVFSDVSTALPDLLKKILEQGADVPSRAGNTKEFTHLGITLTNPLDREILCAGRKANLAAQVAETMWVLAGRDDMEFLGQYLPRAKDFSDDGETWRAGYGKRLREWYGRPALGNIGPFDQLRYVVDTLKNDPGSRQAVMSIWDPAIDTAPGKDIPCNDWLHFLYRDGKLDLMVAIRSNDAIWGWSGINQFEWSALLEVVAGLCEMNVGSLHFAVTSWHLYEHHFEKAKKIVHHLDVSDHIPTNLGRVPRFNLRLDPCLEAFDDLCSQWFDLEEQIRNGYVKTFQVERFPEPMMQSWLRVLQWWWTGDLAHLQPYRNTRLYQAALMSVQPKIKPPVKVEDLTPGGPWTRHGHPIPGVTMYGSGRPDVARCGGPGLCSTCSADSIRLQHSDRSTRLLDRPGASDFAVCVTKLHNEKHEAYGDSWKRRGEMLGILANIARKIDRLGGGETKDETSADTAIDLLVYLCKYRVWLSEFHPANRLGDSNTPDAANEIVFRTEREQAWPKSFSLPQRQDRLTEWFTHLEAAATSKSPSRDEIVDSMIPEAFALAEALWSMEQAQSLGLVGGDHDLP